MATDTPKQLGMIGLGRMGSNLVRRLMADGHHCVVFDLDSNPIRKLVEEGATGADDLEGLVSELSPPRVVWLIVPAGHVQDTVDRLASVLSSPDRVAKAGAEYVVSTAHAAVAATGRFHFAVSGGRTPWAMFDLTNLDVPWKASAIYQVDERVAPRHDPDRNLSHVLDHLGEAPVEVVPMPVESDELDAAAAEYARRFPTRFDLVHLGLGQDGHTASLVLRDPVLEVTDRLVSPCRNAYQGHRRMNLTHPALARARQLMWLVTGQEKREAVALLLAGDSGIPAVRVGAGASLILADVAAAGESG